MRLGAQNVVTTTRGTLYFDNFESRRFSYIGTLPPPDLPQPQLPSEPGWTATNYTYSTAHPHAVSAAGANTYSYDANGNMTCRVENGDVFIQAYNAENRLASVTKVAIISQIWNGICPSPITYAAKWDFAYDGDGTRVTQLYTPYDQNGNPQTPILTVYFMGGAYEMTSNTIRKYYAIAGMTVAMRQDTGALVYLLTDHLGSVVGVTDSSGTLISQQRYLPFGQVRTDIGPSVSQTDFGYTGQRNIASMGLMDYHARMYDPYITHFSQPDPDVPASQGPQGLNRYAYVSNDPINNTDPTGHCVKASYENRIITDDECELGTVNDQLRRIWRIHSYGLTYKQQRDLLLAAMWAGVKLYNAYGASKGYQSPEDAFTKLFGDFSVVADNSRTDCKTSSDTMTVSCGTRARYTNAFLHEFGHVLDIRSGLMASDLDSYNYQGLAIDGGLGNSWVRGSEGFLCVDSATCMEHPPYMGYGDACKDSKSAFCIKTQKEEQWADLFLNWVLDEAGVANHGFSPDSYGDARRTYMGQQFNWLFEKGYLP